MKKNFLSVIISLIGAITLLSSCSKDTTEGKTFITYYPTLSLEGETFIVLAKGSEYQEPGYEAILNGKDVTNDVKVNHNINKDKSGLYTITYTIANADGFGKSSARQILVIDMNDPVEGLYKTTLESHRMASGTRTDYGKEFDLYILSNGNGTYTINDMLGGYYEQRAGYGSDYAMVGVFSVEDDGTIVGISGDVAGWGDSMDSLDDAQFDKANSTISWKVVYADMDFYVTMKKQ